MTVKKPKTLNGVKIIEHKNWNTVKFYTSTGYLINTYRHCPKEIPFKSKYHSHENQHLCGGWHYFEHPDEEILNRVLNGLKPCGELHFREDDQKELEKMIMRLSKIKNLWHHVEKMSWGIYRVYVCPKGKSLVDLLGEKNIIKLMEVYEDIGPNVLAYAYKPMSDYYKIWSDDLTEYNIKGLFLGYPFDITLSLYE